MVDLAESVDRPIQKAHHSAHAVIMPARTDVCVQMDASRHMLSNNIAADSRRAVRSEDDKARLRTRLAEFLAASGAQ